MPRPLILASASAIRLQLLHQAGIEATALPARIDEAMIRASLEADAPKPRDIADALAEMKARKVAERHPTALVLGCDQVLAFNGQIFGKPETIDDARSHLHALRGQTHQLLSAIVLYDDAKPIWRHVATASLTMREASDSYIDAYLARNWTSIQHSVGGYKLEEEGIRLFTSVVGDYFTILGLPMIPLVSFLATRGFVET